ncbi:hypothetical protein GCM10022271_15700 [Corallibacter vietnamensis]|uniref:Glycosyl transferase family 1 domain-containing protein n=1 Tax=Corallibacter vietnamensis TaxID=904130 RepID=A0ABP7H4B6_9FLAO
MKRKDKLVIVSLMEGFPWGGSEELWYNTAVYALKEGVVVNVFIKKWDEDYDKIHNLRSLGAKINYLDTDPKQSKKKILKLISRTSLTVFETIKAIGLKKTDRILMSQGDTFSAFGSTLLANLITLNVPVSLVSQHLHDVGIPNEDLRKKARLTVSKIKHFCFVSQRSLNLTKRYLNSDGYNFHLVNNPVNLDRKVVIEYPDLSIPSFAVVGRLDCRFKGQDILIEVLSQDKWKVRHWTCNLYGKGNDENYLKDLIDHYGLKEKVFLKGHVDSVEDIWRANHLLVLPSISEGTPLSLVEANICGRPAVVTDVGGNTEVIVENENGWIAEAPLKTYLEKAMENAWKNKEKWKEMGVVAHKRAMKRYKVNAGKELFDLIRND